MKYPAATAFVASAFSTASAWSHPVTAASTSFEHLAEHLLLVAVAAVPLASWWLIRRHRAKVRINRD